MFEAKTLSLKVKLINGFGWKRSRFGLGGNFLGFHRWTMSVTRKFYEEPEWTEKFFN